MLDLLRNMRNGTFLEIGGNDGWKTTNTYHLEQCLGWQGIMIEGHPQNFQRMLRARPGVLSLGIAACKEHGVVAFTNRSGVASGINDLMSSHHKKRFHIVTKDSMLVPCGPLGDWLAALHAHSIDYFSLDVEGAEMLVLETLDWSALTVGVLLVECTSSGLEGCISERDRAIGSYLSKRGLTRLGAFRARHDIWDLVFVNRTRMGELAEDWNQLPWHRSNTTAVGAL